MCTQCNPFNHFERSEDIRSIWRWCGRCRWEQKLLVRALWIMFRLNFSWFWGRSIRAFCRHSIEWDSDSNVTLVKISQDWFVFVCNNSASKHTFITAKRGRPIFAIHLVCMCAYEFDAHAICENEERQSGKKSFFLSSSSTMLFLQRELTAFCCCRSLLGAFETKPPIDSFVYVRWCRRWRQVDFANREKSATIDRWKRQFSVVILCVS